MNLVSEAFTTTPPPHPCGRNGGVGLGAHSLDRDQYLTEQPYDLVTGVATSLPFITEVSAAWT